MGKAEQLPHQKLQPQVGYTRHVLTCDQQFNTMETCSSSSGRKGVNTAKEFFFNCESSQERTLTLSKSGVKTLCPYPI